MKKLMLLLTIFSNLLMANEPIKTYVETSIYFIPNHGEREIQDVVHMKKYYGGYNEMHSSEEDPGGEWNIETRLNEENIFEVLFWIKDKTNPEINKSFNVSKLDMTTESLFKNNKGELKININPKIIEEELKSIKLGIDNFGLNSFCFKNSPMIMDDNFYIGKLKGFAERIEIRIPSFYDIDIALKPLRDWKKIGVYEDGVINIDVDENHILTLLNVGIGPSGYKKGGPFIVYGKMKQPTHDRDEMLANEENYLQKNVSKRIRRIITKANKENLYSVAGITTASEGNTSKHLSRTIGGMFMFSDKGCG